MSTEPQISISIVIYNEDPLLLKKRLNVVFDAKLNLHIYVIDNSPYKEQYEASLKMMDEHVDGGNDPNEMAEAILKIINTPKPKIHYKVGVFMHKFPIVLNRILPAKVYEKLLMNHYKL